MSFDKFWLTYPNKKAKGQARKAWEKAIKLFDNEEHLLKTCLLAIDAQEREKKRLKSSNEFCPQWPMPATWLNGERWSDKVITHNDIQRKKDLKFCKCGEIAKHRDLCDTCYQRKVDEKNGYTDLLREHYKRVPPRKEGETYHEWAKRVFNFGG